MKVNIVSSYLRFLNEREVDAPTENPGAFDINVYKDVMTNVHVEPLHNVRQTLQPTLYGIYFKNALGDYRGRYDSINARRHQSLGVDDFERDKDELKKGEKYSSTYLPKETDTRLRFKQGGYPSETNDPDQFLAQYPAGDLGPIGGDGGDGGPGGPGGGGGG
jgi:hypothetical protein